MKDSIFEYSNIDIRIFKFFQMEIRIYLIFVFGRNIVLKYIRYSYFSKMCLANIFVFVFGPKFDIRQFVNVFCNRAYIKVIIL